jgi:hypothetical protein
MDGCAAFVPSVSRTKIKHRRDGRLSIRVAMQLLTQGFEFTAKVESNTVNGVDALVQIPIS